MPYHTGQEPYNPLQPARGEFAGTTDPRNLGNISQALYGDYRQRRPGAQAGSAFGEAPDFSLGAELGYQPLGALQRELSMGEAAGRFGQEQQRGEQWAIRRFMDAQGRYGALEGGELFGQAQKSALEFSRTGGVPESLLDRMYGRQADVIEGETRRQQAGVQSALAARGLSASGQGLGAIAGGARARMQALTGARRDVDIWGAQERLKGQFQGQAALNALLGLKAQIAGRRADLDMSLRLSPTDYSGFTKTQPQMISPYGGAQVIGYGGGGGGQTPPIAGYDPTRGRRTGEITANQLTSTTTNKLGAPTGFGGLPFSPLPEAQRGVTPLPAFQEDIAGRLGEPFDFQAPDYTDISGGAGGFAFTR